MNKKSKNSTNEEEISTSNDGAPQEKSVLSEADLEQLELGQLHHLRLIAALNDGELTEDEFVQGQMFCLLEDLKRGDINAACLLRGKGVRLFPEGEYCSRLFELESEHLQHLYSVQADPDQLVRVNSISEVIDECGPFYLGPSRSTESRPLGWARAAEEDRVLSWHDEGFGMVGDQLMNIRFRVMSSKPLTRFRGACLAGPFEAPEESIPEELSQPDWERFKLKPDVVNIDAFRRFCLETGTICNDIHLTKRYAERRHRFEVLVMLFAYVDDHPAEVRREIHLARATFTSDLEEREAFLQEAIACDPSIQNRVELLRLWGEVQGMTGTDNPDRSDLREEDLLARLRSFRADTPIEEGLRTAAVLQVQGPSSISEILGLLLPFHPELKRVETPYESIALQSSCQRLFIRVLEQDSQAAQDSEVLRDAIRCGFRPNGQSIGIKACSPEYLEVLEMLLGLGFYTRGWLTPIGVYVPLGTALSDQNATGVRMLLEHGADPLEPTHYGGQDSFELAESLADAELISLLRKA